MATRTAIQHTEEAKRVIVEAINEAPGLGLTKPYDVASLALHRLSAAGLKVVSRPKGN
jgi:hypothetical protein